MNLPPAPPKTWTERYETLRRHYVENRQCLATNPLGLTLFLRKGMAAWIRTWRSCTATAPTTLAPAPPSWPPPTSPLWQQELTRLIAQMTAQHLHPIPRL